jgi:hypothetical protein
VLDLLKSVTTPEHRFGTVLAMQIILPFGLRICPTKQEERD